MHRGSSNLPLGVNIVTSMKNAFKSPNVQNYSRKTISDEHEKGM